MTTKRVSERQVSVSGAAPARSKAAVPQRVKRSAAQAVTEPIAASASKPSYQAIASLAYSYWEARGCTGGSSEEDWLRAEQQLRAAVTA